MNLNKYSHRELQDLVRETKSDYKALDMVNQKNLKWVRDLLNKIEELEQEVKYLNELRLG